MSTLTTAPAERNDGAGTSPQRTGLPPHALLWDLATSAMVSRCLHVAAELGVADALPVEGGDVDTLADELGVDADALGRVLRALAAHGVFEVELPAVGHSDASRLLRSDHPMSMGPFAHMMGLPMCWEALTALTGTVETGRAGILALDDDGLFAYLRHQPDERAIFDRAMTAKSHADIGCLLGAYDFGAHGTVADVGGGRGHLLQAITERHPNVKALLVELPEVIEAVAMEQTAGAATQLVSADFFADDLPVADAYVLMEVIHDWDDEDAVRILSNIRRSAPDHGVVLLVETVLMDRPGPDAARTLDIIMLTVTGGRERTPAQYQAIFDAAGFEMSGVIPTGGAVQLVEARVRP